MSIALRCAVCLLVLTALLPVVSSLPDGAPLDACDSMMPSHGASPQKTCSYIIKVSKTELFSNGTLDVTLQTPDDGTDGFRGFLLMAFDNSSNSGFSPIGTFDDNSGSGQSLNCNDTPKSALTHSTSSIKKTVTASWNAPADFGGWVVFKATIVQTKKVFCMKKSEAVRVKRLASGAVKSLGSSHDDETNSIVNNKTSNDVSHDTTTKKPSATAKTSDNWFRRNLLLLLQRWASWLSTA